MDPSLPAGGPPVQAAPAVSVAQFTRNLVDSTLLSAAEVQALAAGLAPSADGRPLALDLVKQGKLTQYQASALYQGKTRGLVLGRYVILEKVGAGGMGMVFKAKQRGMNRIVAIKVLPPAVAVNPSSVKRFQREVEAAARLTHPNIVATYDANHDQGVYFLVMEYVEGTDLSALVKSRGRLAVGQALNCIQQAARGLEFAHAMGVIHRDIKPANLLLDVKAGVKILDMGLARFDEGENTPAGVSDLTKTGSIMGTSDFMAPEQAINTRKADQRADIYSLGCTLHYLLTGQPMYRGDTPMEKMLAHREEPIPPLPGAPPGLQAVYQRMVAKKAAERYQSMSELIKALDSCMDVSARRNTALITAAKEAASAPSDPWNFDDTAPDIRRTTKFKPPRQPGKRWLLIGGTIALLALVVLVAVLASLRPLSKPVVQQPPETSPVATNRDDLLKGFVPLFNGKDLAGWKVDSATTNNWGVANGVIFTTGAPENWLMTEKLYGDLELRLEYRVSTGGDSGVALRSALGGDPAKQGIEIQMRDDPNFSGGELSPTYACGAIAGIVRPIKPSARPAGEWNQLTIVARGREITVEQNGTKIVDVNVDDYKSRDWPGRERAIGHIGLQSLKGRTEFRNIAIKLLDSGAPTALPPVSEAWLKSVAALPPPKQADAVAAELVRLNPSFTGKVERKVENNVVREVSFLTDHVTDISPVRALAGLERLHCTGSGPGKGKLADLRPLAGLRLKELFCFHNPAVKDLMPLKGMPLQKLNCGGEGVQIADLGPLAGMPLQSLMVSQCPVSDLTPLKGLPLTTLHCGGTKVSDLICLQGMPLTVLHCHSTKVQDLSPIKGAPLKELKCDFQPARDAALLRAIKTLERINDMTAAEFWKKHPE